MPGAVVAVAGILQDGGSDAAADSPAPLNSDVLIMLLLTALLMLLAFGTARADDLPPSFGGRYPYLAVSNWSGECGFPAAIGSAADDTA